MKQMMDEKGMSAEEKWQKNYERNLERPGGRDTVTLNRAQFRLACGRGFSVDGSNYDPEKKVPSYGRLNILLVILGEEKSKEINSFFAQLIEDYIFGPEGGEKSPYRVEKREGEEKKQRSTMRRDALAMLAADKIRKGRIIREELGEEHLGRMIDAADYFEAVRNAFERCLYNDAELWDRVEDSLVLKLMISFGNYLTDVLFEEFARGREAGNDEEVHD